MGFQTVGIVGLGLLGGSLAMSIRQKGLAEQIVGFGRNEEHLQAALQSKVVDLAQLCESSQDFKDKAASLDLLIFCTPVKHILETIDLFAPAVGSNCLVSDVGSSKTEIAHKGHDAFKRFVGAHPMAGSEKQGLENARLGLYEDKLCVLTPMMSTAKKDIQALQAFWQDLGAKVHLCSPELHDEMVAMTSHLPHVAASLLAYCLSDHHKDFIGDGFLDSTRVASGSPEMWRDICLSNQEALLEVLSLFASDLEMFIEALKTENSKKVLRFFQSAKKKRDALL